MQRRILDVRVAPGNEDLSAASQAWQAPNSSYGGVKLYNPNELSASSGNLSYQQNVWTDEVYSGVPSQTTMAPHPQQWNWSNGNPQQALPNNDDWTSDNNYQGVIEGNLHGQYVHQPTLQPDDLPAEMHMPQQNPWNAVQHPPQSEDLAGFQGSWNWYTGEAVNATEGSENSAASQEVRQGPDGRDPWLDIYPNWRDGRQVPIPGDWNAQRQPSQLYPSTVSNQASWDQSNLINSSYTSSSGSFFEGSTSADHQDYIQSSSVSDSNIASETTLTNAALESSGGSVHVRESKNNIEESQNSDFVRSCSDVTVRDETNFNESENSKGTGSALHQDGISEVMPSESPKQDELEENVDCQPEQVVQPPIESLGPSGIYGRAPYLRCDSWISNSSLLTYNRSTTGSQEFLSGSFYGDEGPISMGSISGICHSIDDTHLSSPQSLPFQLQHPHHQHHSLHHRLHSSLLGHHADASLARMRRRSSVEDQIISLPLDAANKLDVSLLTKEARRSSLPNVSVLSGEEAVSDVLQPSVADGNSESVVKQCDDTVNHGEILPLRQPDPDVQEKSNSDVLWNHEGGTNLEVPPSTSKGSSPATIHADENLEETQMRKMLNAENVEVVQTKAEASELPLVNSGNGGAYKMPGWSRESSAFQPVVGKLSNITPVIQREVLDRKPKGALSDGEIEKEKAQTVPEAANMETLPDNVERPLDADVSNVKKKPTSSRSALHSSFSRQHIRDTNNSSPVTSLWENPEIQDYGVVLAPAALPTNPQLLPSQDALVIPQLHRQQEILDNPLGGSVPPVQLSKPPAPVKTVPPPTLTTRKDIKDKSVVAPNLSTPKATTAAPPVASMQSNPSSAPLDLSNRATPQGWSAADSDSQVVPPSDIVNQDPLATLHSLSSRPVLEGDDRRRFIDGRISNERDQDTSRRSNYNDSRGDQSRHSYERGDEMRQFARDNALPRDPREEGNGHLQSQRNDILPRDPRAERDGSHQPRRDDFLPKDGRDGQDDRHQPQSGDPLARGPRDERDNRCPPQRDAVLPRGHKDERDDRRQPQRDVLPRERDRREERDDRRPSLRDEFLPRDPRDERERGWNQRLRGWDREREKRPDDPYYPLDYGSSERDRVRPSSRSSVRDYDTEGRDRYYDRSQYPLSQDVDSAGYQPRPSSRSGYESDSGVSRHRNSYDSNQGNIQSYRTGYDPYADYYQRNAHSSGYADYYRQYDPRMYPSQYYVPNQYNYGYYAELYGSDPRYRAYYESMAKEYYWRYGGVPYGSEDYDRRSVHSGRSSVTDDSRKGSERYASGYLEESANPPSSERDNELSAVYANNDSGFSRDVDSLVDVSDQYPTASDTLPDASSQRLTPFVYPSPHVRATFAPNGELVILPSSDILNGQVGTVEICDIQNVYANDPVSQELNSFPGPLLRGDTHKNDVIQYCLQKVRNAKEDANISDRDSCILIWELLVLIVRQNGVVVGTDIAELLLQGSTLSSELTATSKTGHHNVSSDGDELASDQTILQEGNDVNVPGPAQSQNANKFLELILFGHKKDALELAMKEGLWGHALFLASKIDSRTYAMVMTRFANSLAFNDPLQTLFQLMSGRQPAAATCIADEKWGDWRPHLAIILSNSTQRPDLDCKSIITMGDTLAARGCLHAAHFCYLMAQVEFGTYDKKLSKIVLIGSNHSQPFSLFATIEAIQCMEVYEYGQSLASPYYCLPHLQLYKFIYAIRLAEYGRPQDALHYCELITRAIQKSPASYNVELVNQVYELAFRLKYHDPYYTQEEGEVADLGDPTWLRELQAILESYSTGHIQPLEQDFMEQSQLNSTNEIGQIQMNYGMQSPSASAEAQGDLQFQQHFNTYTNVNQVPGEGDLQQYSNYVDYSQQLPGQHEYESSYADNLEVAQQQQQQLQPSSYYGEDSSPPAADQLGQNLPTSQYNYYYPVQSNADVTATNVENHVEARPEQQLHADNGDYYGISTRKSSVPSFQTSTQPLAAKSFGESNNDKSVAKKSPEQEKSIKGDKRKPKQGSSWLGGIFSKLSLKPQNQMILPDDKNPTLVWDSAKGKWINTDSDDEEESSGPAAPPKDMDMPSSAGITASGTLPPRLNNSSASATLAPTENVYKLRPSRGNRKNYVDVLGGNTIPVSSTAVTKDLFSSLNSPLNQGNVNTTPHLFIPAPVESSNETFTDFVTTGDSKTSSSMVANPSSRGGSPQGDSEPEDDSQTSQSSSPSSLSREVQSYFPDHQTVSKTEDAPRSDEQQPLMFNTAQIRTTVARPSGISTGAEVQRGGLRKYGSRYPR